MKCNILLKIAFGVAILQTLVVMSTCSTLAETDGKMDGNEYKGIVEENLLAAKDSRLYEVPIPVG